MIVVAIIAILAAAAMSAFQDYTIRSKVAEALALASGAKQAVAETYSSNGAWPTSNASAGLAAAATIISNSVSSVTVGAGGIVTIVLSANLGGNPTMNGQSITLTPADAGGSVTWVCAIGGDSTRYHFVPAICRN